jgi:PD-(D/E)XK endonuclease
VRSHHTKDKGDLGVAHAIADLADQGFVVLTALTEHAPFDLVAYGAGAFIRVQVKYRALSSSGTIEVQFRRIWSDANGRHVQHVEKDEIDVVCIYCPDTRSCYYIDPKQFGRSVTLRVVPSRNGQARHIWLASDFSSVPV